ncbi:hypothetical protein GFS60_05094 [Rhodococcus sp. WAY2]|nr:hypothetical protein GFS60_05094 [Rhodococcus sp. WAY2]
MHLFFSVAYSGGSDAPISITGIAGGTMVKLSGNFGEVRA